MFLVAAGLAAFVPLLQAQSFNELASAPDSKKVGPAVCGSAAEFWAIDTLFKELRLKALPGCVRVDTGACLPGTKNCFHLQGDYSQAGKSLVVSDPGTKSIVALDHLGVYKAHAWNMLGSDTWSGWWKANRAFREMLEQAESEAKSAGKTATTKALLRALPSFRSVLALSVESYNKSLGDELAARLRHVDSDTKAKSVLSLLQILKDSGVADDSEVIPDGQLPGLKVRTLVALRAQLTAYIDLEEEKAEAAAETAAAAREAEEAKRKSALAIIKGDRLTYYNMHLKGWYIYVPGRTRIMQPVEFQQASAMFTCDTNKNQTWEVRGSRFDGDNAVGEQYVATGLGSTCPSSAFRLSAFDQ